MPTSGRRPARTRNPELFVDAGWWVAGPYHASLDPRVAFESSAAASPSNPHPPSSASNSPRWHELTTGSLGLVGPGRVSHAGNVAAYALTLLYSVTARDVVLKIGNDDSARFWLNGQQILESPFSPADAHSVIVTLRAGRNVILAKVVNARAIPQLESQDRRHARGFRIRLAESKKWTQAIDAYKKAVALEPDGVDPKLHALIAESLAQSGRWKEAKGPFEKLGALDPGILIDNKTFRGVTSPSAMTSPTGDLESAIARHGKTKDPVLASNVIWLSAHHSRRSPKLQRGRRHRPQVDEHRQARHVSVQHLWSRPLPGKTIQELAGIPEAIDRCTEGHGQHRHGWVFVAMAHHKSMEPGDQDALSGPGRWPATHPYRGKTGSS